jgi:hypothetical protein
VNDYIREDSITYKNFGKSKFLIANGFMYLNFLNKYGFDKYCINIDRGYVKDKI